VPVWLPDLLITLVLVAAFVHAFRIKDDDPVWDERWDALSPADRTRIARAARSGERRLPPLLALTRVLLSPGG
jgi:hypothetical protein